MKRYNMFGVRKELRSIVATRLISLLAILLSMPIYAYDFESGGIYYTIMNEKNVQVASPRYSLLGGYIGYIGDMVIPNKVTYKDNTYNVTSIASGSDYELYTGLTSLIIPNNVKDIGGEAFGPCNSLVSLTIGSGVTSFGWGAFRCCNNLKTVVSKIEKPFEIDNSVFLLLPSDAELIVPKGTKAAYQSTSGWNVFSKITESTEVIFEVSGIFYRVGENNKVYVTKGDTDYQGSIIIPEKVTYDGNTYSVTEIDNEAFSNCSGLTSVSIPNSVVSIGRSAFYGCSDLSSVSIPNSVTSIGSSAFRYCTNLITIIISNSMTTIGDYAFGCSGLTSVTIPNSVLNIGCSAFYNCSSLTSVTIPNSVTSIGNDAFQHCSNLTSVTIPNSVTSIGSWTFYACISLTSITIPNSVTSIGSNAFSWCSGLTSVTIPNSVTSIGRYPFSNCSSLTSIVSEITNPFEISDGVFDSDIYSTATLTVPASTKSLYQSTAGWNEFQNIVEASGENQPIPSPTDYSEQCLTFVAQEAGSFRFIGTSGSIFYSCDNGKSWISRVGYDTGELEVAAGDKIMWEAPSLYFSPTFDGGIGRFSSSGRFYVEGNIMSLLFGRDNFSGQTSLNGYDNAFKCLFSDCTGLTSAENLVLPATTLSYACYYEMFMGCTSLTTVPELPAETLAVFCYSGMFDECTSLRTVPQALLPATTLTRKCYTGMFAGCTSLTTAPELPATTLANVCYANMFWGCTSLTTAPELPATILVSECYLQMFEGCTSLNYIKCLATNISSSAVNCTTNWLSGVSSSGTFVKNSSMSGWSRGTSGIPDGWKIVNKESSGNEGDDIGEVFESGGINYIIGENNTVSVTSKETKYSGDVMIPSQVTYNGKAYSVTSIGNDAFQRSTNLTSVMIPNSVTIIGEDVFYDCKALTSVNIPSNVTSIGRDAFMNCISLTSITIPNSLVSIDYRAFSGCINLSSVISEIENPYEISDDVFSNIHANATLTVPTGTKSLYQNTAGWNKFQNIIEESTDEAQFTLNGIVYQGSKSEKTAVVNSVDKNMVSLDIPASISYDGVDYQVTGIDNDAFKGSNMAALVWDVEAALPNNAFSNASISSNFLLYVKSAAYAPSTVKNVVVDGTAQTIVLSDNGGQFYCPQTFIARSISYTHNYTMETGKGQSKGWEALALPFFVQKINHSTRGEIVPFALFSSSSSQKPFWLAKYSGSGFKRTSAIEANEPYIIAMPNNSKYRNEYNLAGEVTFSAENAAVPKTPDFDGKFLPAFAPIAKSDAIMVLNNSVYPGVYEPGSHFVKNLRDVHPFEAYMTGSSSTRGVIEICFDDGMTDIDDVLISVEEDQEIVIHNLSGQQVARTALCDFDAVWQQLAKGVYIVNGKKKIK